MSYIEANDMRSNGKIDTRNLTLKELEGRKRMLLKFAATHNKRYNEYMEEASKADDYDQFMMGQNTHSDLKNILLLILLYTLQGIPLGLIASVPLLLQNRNVSYTAQAYFSLAYWPFSLKLLWAPIVDAVYIKQFGRRKTWLIPTQYLLAVFMFWLSGSVDSYIDDKANESIYSLTFLFFILNFLAATQDIAVDGWALSMLQRENVGYASTCNSIGQTAGYFLGFMGFMALESADFCNKYLRSIPHDVGIVTLSSFLYFWAIIFIITTTLIMILKKEEASDSNLLEDNNGIGDTYQLVWKILKRKNMQLLLIFLLTSKIAFAATDAVTGLKLQELGVPKNTLAMMAIPIIPIQILIPIVISKYTAGPRPMALYMKAVPFRLFFIGIFAALLYMTPFFKTDDGFSSVYFVLILLSYCLHQLAVYSMFVAVMAFFAKVSDPSVGGTYMTMLNTACNLGGNWPSTLALALVDFVTFKECKLVTSEDFISDQVTCETTLDGYYLECLFCLIFGLLWLPIGKKIINILETQAEGSWDVRSSKAFEKNW